MRPTPARFLSRLSRHLAVGLAFFLSSIGHGRVSAAPNELGHPVVRDFPPGKAGIGHLCPTVTQDAAGFIYIAASTQVRFYDGDTWQFIKLPTESAGVRKFAVTADGTIYMGGASVLGYLRAGGESKEYVSLADRLPPTESGFDDIFDVLAVGNTVYFADEEKILIWRDRRFVVVPYPTPPHSRGARLHRVGDTVYVTALDRPLCRLAHDQLEVVADDPVLRQNQIVSVEPGPAGTLALLTAERGFFQLDTGRVTPLPAEANRWLAGKGILRAQRLADGSLVVAFTSVSGDGGMRFGADGRYLGPIDNSTGLYVKTLRDFFCDREGGLWMGSETGVFRLEWPSAVTVFDAINGLGSGGVADVARQEGVLYAATSEGVFRLAASDAAGRCARFERVSGHPAYSLVSHPGGLLALGYTDLFVQSSAGFTAVAKLPPGGGILRRSKRDPDRVWLGTAHGIQSVRHTPQGWRDEGLIAGFDENTRGLAEASDGSLWVATLDRGLFRFDFGDGKNTGPGVPRVERFAGGRGLPERFKQVNTAEWAGEPTIVLNHTPRPFRFDAALRRFVPLAGTESLPAEISEDGWLPGDTDTGGAEALWLAGSTSIFRVPRKGPPQRLPRLVTATSGAVSRMREENAGAGTVLWICGANGLVRVEVARAFPALVPFATLLTTTGVSEGDHLAPGHGALNFNYVALRHQIADSVAYQTRLVGYDRDWSPWSPKRERIFTTLPAGGYRFEVRARDADGQLSAPAALAFAVLAPWWLTAGALLGYVVAGTGLVVGVVRLRTRALRRRATRLEGVIAERTSELAQKNLDLIRLNRLEVDEKTAARLAEEKARLEVLRYQLNPHFLYNTLASISASLPAGRSTARTMVERLADFCRLTLHRSNEGDWTTLGEEMQLLRAYLEIEQSRWGDLLDIEIACDSVLNSERLPYFLLLPLVENALKHGRATSPDRVGLRLVARREAGGATTSRSAAPRPPAQPGTEIRSAENDTLILEVSNTGKWIEPAAKNTVSSLGIGLDNLRERLARHYPGSHQLTIWHGGGWVTVTLRLTAHGQATGSVPGASPGWR
ncbi:MAG: histidine kinase [Verrucomicrobia bacterium]|nr:histidine kinase [Verrucomicrobiota bacterium]